MAVMCFALCYPGTFDVNFLSREVYRTSSRGIELGLFDICSISLLIILIFQPNGKRFIWFPPLTIVYGFYILMTLFSWALTSGDIPVPGAAIDMYANRGVVFYSLFETSLYPLFELVKLLRGGIVFLMVVNYVQTEEHLKTLIACLMMGAILITIDALGDRYIDGHHRISGTMGHPNSLGTFMAMLGTLMFGFALFRETFFSSGTFGITTAACLASVFLTISRGALSAFIMGIWIDVSALFHRYLNAKNFTILFCGSVMALGLFYAAADTITARFLGQQDAVSDIQYRGLYNDEARLMAADHPFGVGLGNFSAYSWIKYGQKVGLHVYGTQAHNVWFLTLGELGYPGLIAFIAYWLRFLSIGLPFLFCRRKSMFYAAAAAATAAIMIGHIQFMLQLSYRQTPIYMLSKILMGIVVAAWYIDRDIRREEKQLRAAQRK
ncbi:O-antigen ligase family protein [Tichowtungia aerotolerans]|uniref:O-antigen ligase-related domain-containing protein n=1 Tax=Tichowtungia aerotolerans TaxID=2697043 RepID=A0A6P1M9H3_9BACT|nr:O-antigen ligase family protein [Tichowtungia aerotolerans]QHI70547.1 hypothetical protein GT409_14230 [Tichowtungia aerotolerans]